MGGRQTTLSKSKLHFRPHYECQRKVENKVYLRLCWELDAIYFLASLAKGIWVRRSNWRLEFCAVEPFSVAADDQQAAVRQVAHSKTAVCAHVCAEAHSSEFMNRVGIVPSHSPRVHSVNTVPSLCPSQHTHTELPLWYRNSKCNLTKVLFQGKGNRKM